MGFTVVFNRKDLFTCNVFLLTFEDTLFTDFFATYTVITCFAPFEAPLTPFTVILAVPAFFPVTTPLLSTVATLFLPERKLRLDAFTIGDSFNVFFVSKGITTLFSVLFFTRFFTVTFIFLLTFLLADEVTVTMALPAFRAFIVPLEVTFTTSGALLS